MARKIMDLQRCRFVNRPKCLRVAAHKDASGRKKGLARKKFRVSVKLGRRQLVTPLGNIRRAGRNRGAFTYKIEVIKSRTRQRDKGKDSFPPSTQEPTGDLQSGF